MGRYTRRIPEQPAYLRPGQVARLLCVNVKTVNRWSKEGKLPHRKTLGGHRRFEERAILELLETLTYAPNRDSRNAL